MDFLNRAYGQLSDLFSTMTVGARITAALLLTAIVVSLAYLFTFQIHAGDDYLFGAREFSQAELDAMEQAFGAAGLDDFDFSNYRVRVPHHKRYQYLQALSENNFTPENFDSAIDEVLSSNNSWFESKQLRELRVKHATQKKLARMVAEISGVKNATVQYDEQRKGGYPPVIEKKAIVAVTATGLRPLNTDTIRAVRRTVCGGVAGLEPENVTVTDLVGSRSYIGTNDAGEFGAADTVYADTKAMFEKYWQQKIYDILSIYPGIIVGVNVELDPDLKNATNKVSYDPQPTTVESNTLTKTSDTKPQNGGRPGSVPNQVVQSNVPRDITAMSNMSSTSEETKENQVSVAGHEQTIQEKAPLTPQRVTASIQVPESYFVKLYQERNPTPAGQDPQPPDPAQLTQIESEIRLNIQNSVDSLLPYADQVVSADRRVRVTSYADMKAEPIPEPGFSETALIWLAENWQTLGLFLIGAISLLMLRSMIRSASGSNSQPAVAMNPATPTETESGHEDEDEEPAVHEHPMLSRQRSHSGASLRDELTAMVKDNPEAAANVIRNWIGDAA
jgi:flagellar M-ring protein FliF